VEDNCSPTVRFSTSSVRVACPSIAVLSPASAALADSSGDQLSDSRVEDCRDISGRAVSPDGADTAALAPVATLSDLGFAETGGGTCVLVLKPPEVADMGCIRERISRSGDGSSSPVSKSAMTALLLGALAEEDASPSSLKRSAMEPGTCRLCGRRFSPSSRLAGLHEGARLAAESSTALLGSGSVILLVECLGVRFGRMNGLS
jgi:hypothetical protein